MKAGPLAAITAALPILGEASVGQQRKSRNDAPVAVVFARVPEKARTKGSPFKSDADAAAAGQKLFKQHCAECHGAMAAGAKRGPSLVANGMQQVTAGQVFWIVTNGVMRRGMPPWSKVPEPQRWQIVTFLRQSR